MEICHKSVCFGPFKTGPHLFYTTHTQYISVLDAMQYLIQHQEEEKLRTSFTTKKVKIVGQLCSSEI